MPSYGHQVSKTRVDWVDVSKGLGIILVVVGHTKFRHIDFIYTFHMPLFFIISGVIFNLSKYDGDFKKFVISRFKRLIIPYFCSCVFFYTFWVFLGRKFGEGAEKGVPILKPLLGIFYGNGINDWLTFNTPLWFLPCLFISELIFFIILSLSRNELKKILFGVLVTSLIGFITSKVLLLPWGIDIAFVAQLFMLVGYQIRSSRRLIPIFGGQAMIFIVLSFILLVTSYHINGRVDMNGRVYKDVILFYLGGITGSFLIFFLSQVIAKHQAIKGFFVKCGMQTLIILAFHNISFKIISAIMVFFLHLPLKWAQQEWWPIYSLSGLLIPMYLGSAGKGNIIKKVYY